MHCSFQVFAGKVANVWVPPVKLPLGNWKTVSPIPDMVQLIWLKGMVSEPLVRLAGVVTVSVDGRSFKVSAKGERAKVPQAMADVLLGVTSLETLDARLVQPYYTRILAHSAGLGISMGMEGEDMVVVSAV